DVAGQHGRLLLADHLERLHLDLLQTAALAGRLGDGVGLFAHAVDVHRRDAADRRDERGHQQEAARDLLADGPVAERRALHGLLPPLEAGPQARVNRAELLRVPCRACCPRACMPGHAARPSFSASRSSVSTSRINATRPEPRIAEPERPGTSPSTRPSGLMTVWLSPSSRSTTRHTWWS